MWYTDHVVAVLKKGEAVIPDYANPFNGVSSKVSSMMNSRKYSDNSCGQTIITDSGNITIEGNATQETVEALRKERDNIISEMFKRMNKHTNIGGVKNIKLTV